MKRLLLSLFLTSVNAFAATEDDRVASRADALELAGAWSNDGFKIRDGYWAGDLTPGEPKRVQVNLFSGNQYWFSVAAQPRAKEIAIVLFDEKGKPVATEPYNAGPRAAAGFSPKVSGPYYLQITSKEGPRAAFCLVYSYK